MDDKIYNNPNIKNNNSELFNNYKVQNHSNTADIYALRKLLKAFRMTLECLVPKTQDK